jgi:soluble lytic murein transglycosylase-like protein
MFSIRTVLIMFCLILFGAVWSYEIRKSTNGLPDGAMDIQHAPPCIQLYDYLKIYSDKYNVPFHIAYGIAQKETAYKGPFHWAYNPKLTSSAAAYGAMQIQVPTANFIWQGKKKITSKKLLNDLELNVETSMKLLSYLKGKYGSWQVALGCYNTGYPVINQYAIDIINTKI